MSFLQDFIENLDVQGLLSLLVRIVASLICIVFHECAHGFVADLLGDHTARRRGRLSWSPLRHIDPWGLVMMVVAGVGWAKPVPVDPSNFKKPRQGMALTALAGPVANLLMAYVCLLLGNGAYHLLVGTLPSGPVWQVVLYIYYLLVRMAILSVGLGLFNLIPIPPLDGAKVLYSFLPDRAYFTILRYERYIMIALFALVFLGVFNAPLNACIQYVLALLCRLTGFPAALMGL